MRTDIGDCGNTNFDRKISKHLVTEIRKSRAGEASRGEDDKHDGPSNLYRMSRGRPVKRLDRVGEGKLFRQGILEGRRPHASTAPDVAELETASVDGA